MTEIPYEDIDMEIRNLVRYLNMLDGIETIESCFGHNEAPCFIWFKADSIKAINDMVFNIFNNDCLWKIEIDNQDFHSDYKELRFVLSSGEIKDFPTVNLMIDNLTYRLEKWLIREKQSKNEGITQKVSKPTRFEFDEEQEQIDFVPSYKSIPCKIKVQADKERSE